MHRCKQVRQFFRTVIPEKVAKHAFEFLVVGEFVEHTLEGSLGILEVVGESVDESSVDQEAHEEARH